MVEKTLGQIAYEAHSAMDSRVFVMGSYPWEEVAEPRRPAWEAAGQAVAAHLDPAAGEPGEGYLPVPGGIRIGPECQASADGRFIRWRGIDYYPWASQPDHQQPVVINAVRCGCDKCMGVEDPSA